MNPNNTKIMHLNISDIKPPKLLTKKYAITPKKINLCKKYFYIDNNKEMNLQKLNTGKFLQLMDDNNKQEKGGVLEQVDYIITQFEQKKSELNKKKIDCIKSLILNNKKIPEKWIMKPNYKQILNEAMEDEIVLNYAILCQDKYKKTAGMDKTDDERYMNYIMSLPLEKKFISYINPYSRNYIDTPIKKQIMNDYCLSIRRDNNKFKRNRYNNDNSLNGEKNSRLNKKLSHDKFNISIGNISKENNKLPMINKKNKINIDENNDIRKKDINKCNNMNETKDELMVTSLYYSNLDTKNKYDKDNNDSNNIKLPELPII